MRTYGEASLKFKMENKKGKELEKDESIFVPEMGWRVRRRRRRKEEREKKKKKKKEYVEGGLKKGFVREIFSAGPSLAPSIILLEQASEVIYHRRPHAIQAPPRCIILTFSGSASSAKSERSFMHFASMLTDFVFIA